MTILTNSNIYFYIVLTLAERKTPANTITLYIGNREFQNTTTNIVAALKEVTGIGNELQGNIPALTAGKVSIDNTPGLFGGNRRFSDYLRDYAIVNQNIKLYYNDLYTQDFELNGLSGATLLWQDLVHSASYDEKSAILTLRSDLISNKTCNYKIPAGTISYQLNESIGKIVPLILGENQYVKPVPLQNSDGTATVRAYYGTSFHSQFRVDQGTPTVLLKTRHGDYQPVANPASNFTAIVGTVSTGSGAQALPNALGGQALKVTFGSDGYLFSHCKLTVNKHASGPADETVQIGIWSKHPDKDKPDKLMTSGGTIVAGDLSTGVNEPILIFDPPFFCEPNSTYYFGFFTDTQDDGTTNRLRYYHVTVAYNTKKYVIESGTGERLGVWKSGEQSPNRNYSMAFYAIRFDFSQDSATDTEGYRARGFHIQSTYGWASKSIFSSLDMIIKTNGIVDDGSGTITGSAGAVIKQPQHIAKLLSLSWNGSTWTGGNFDSSTYSSTHSQHSASTAAYYRIVGGVTTGAIQRNRLLATIGQETLTFFPRVNTTNNFAMYSLGTSTAVVATITDKDILSLRVNISDRSGVVTIAKASYLKDLTRADFISTVSQGGENNYANFVELRYNDGGLGQALAANSYLLYGENEIGKKTYDWISDSTSMRNVLKAILGLNLHPPVFLDIDVPLLPYTTLKLFDNIRIITPQMPMLEGSDTRGFVPIYNTNEQPLADTDNETFHGYAYDAQIVSVKYDLMTSALPILNLRVRLLVNDGAL